MVCFKFCSLFFFWFYSVLILFLKKKFNEYLVRNKNIFTQGLAEGLYLRYLQRWGKDYLRRRLDWTIEEAGSNAYPRHLHCAMCPCQYAEEVFTNKPRKESKSCCSGIHMLV